MIKLNHNESKYSKETHLGHVLGLGDELVTDLDPGLYQVLVHVIDVDTAQSGDTGTFLWATTNLVSAIHYI